MTLAEKIMTILADTHDSYHYLLHYTPAGRWQELAPYLESDDFHGADKCDQLKMLLTSLCQADTRERTLKSARKTSLLSGVKRLEKYMQAAAEYRPLFGCYNKIGNHYYAANKHFIVRIALDAPLLASVSSVRIDDKPTSKALPAYEKYFPACYRPACRLSVNMPQLIAWRKEHQAALKYYKKSYNSSFPVVFRLPSGDVLGLSFDYLQMWAHLTESADLVLTTPRDSGKELVRGQSKDGTLSLVLCPVRLSDTLEPWAELKKEQLAAGVTAAAPIA